MFIRGVFILFGAWIRIRIVDEYVDKFFRLCFSGFCEEGSSGRSVGLEEVGWWGWVGLGGYSFGDGGDS